MRTTVVVVAVPSTSERMSDAIVREERSMEMPPEADEGSRHEPARVAQTAKIPWFPACADGTRSASQLSTQRPLCCVASATSISAPETGLMVTRREVGRHSLRRRVPLPTFSHHPSADDHPLFEQPTGREAFERPTFEELTAGSA